MKNSLLIELNSFVLPNKGIITINVFLKEGIFSIYWVNSKIFSSLNETKDIQKIWENPYKKVIILKMGGAFIW